MRRSEAKHRTGEPKRIVTITISMPKRLLRQVTRLRKHYCYPTMSEYVRERLMADLRLPSPAESAPIAANSQAEPEPASPIRQ